MQDEKKDFHIFFINAYSSAAREIFCEVSFVVIRRLFNPHAFDGRHTRESWHIQDMCG